MKIKPPSRPKKTNPIQTQFLQKPKMNVNLYVIKEYENETAFRLQKNKPKQTQFQTRRRFFCLLHKRLPHRNSVNKKIPPMMINLNIDMKLIRTITTLLTLLLCVATGCRPVQKKLIDRIVKGTDIKRVIIKPIIQNFLDEIISELPKGNRLEFYDFGVFEPRDCAPRTAQNPKTLEQIHVSGKRVVKFKAGR